MPPAPTWFWVRSGPSGRERLCPGISKKSTDSPCIRELLPLIFSLSDISSTARTAMTAHRDDNPMLTRHRNRRLRGAFVVALLLLGAVLLTPGTLQASCGSHVTFGSPSKYASQPAAPQTGFGELPPAAPSGKPRPCSGPGCSNRPLIPPVPAVPPVGPPGDEASGIAAFTLIAETSSAPLAESLSPLHPLQHPRSVFHPPRLPRHCW